MATGRQCSTCEKETGAMHCIGCDAYFCTKDFRRHREILFSNMDGLVEKRNDLQAKIDDAAQKNNSCSPLITSIDKWEETTIEKVRQAADRARQEVGQLLNSRRMKITTDFKIFSEELAHLKETENFVEHDLTRLKQKIDNFYQDLQQIMQPLMIDLHTEQSDRIEWNRIIYVEEKSNYTRHQQQ